jgi:hypothetical protein
MLNNCMTKHFIFCHFMRHSKVQTLLFDQSTENHSLSFLRMRNMFFVPNKISFLNRNLKKKQPTHFLSTLKIFYFGLNKRVDHIKNSFSCRPQNRTKTTHQKTQSSSSPRPERKRNKKYIHTATQTTPARRDQIHYSLAKKPLIRCRRHDSATGRAALSQLAWCPPWRARRGRRRLPRRTPFRINLLQQQKQQQQQAQGPEM